MGLLPKTEASWALIVLMVFSVWVVSADESRSKNGASSLRLLERIQDTIKNPYQHEKPRIPTADKEDCQNASLVSKELQFGDKMRLDNNFTWGENVLQPLLCASEYVLLYTDETTDEETGETTKNLVPLCRSFDVDFKPDKNDNNTGNFRCSAKLNKTMCGREVIVVLEVWLLTGRLLQASSKMAIDCNEKEEIVDDDMEVVDEEEEEEDDDDEVPSTPLVLSPSVVARSCAWSEWTEWSDCPITCGDKPGRRTRTRGQTGSRICVKTERDEKPCHVNKCPQDCQFKPWSEWTSCSRTCGTGVQTRTRAIDRYQEYGGKPCKGERAEKRSCDGGDCAADGDWSQWGAWGYCQASCGEGIKKRVRACDDPKPENGGKDCLGVSEEVQKCQIKKCDVIDGNWSPWSRWGGCSRKCGPGHIIRRRTCTNPMPENGGTECEGENEERRKCYLRGCYDKTTTTTASTTTTETTAAATTTITAKDTQEPRTTTHDDAKESCLFPAPKVFGYSGPYETVKSDTEDHNLTVKIGDYAFYRCHSGKVSNLRTNSRIAALECLPNRTFSTVNLPICQRPQHCVGALPLRQDGLGKVMGIPSRDQKVNSHISIMCSRDNKSKLPQLTAYGSCFSDGIIRYPNIPPCKNPKFAPTSNLNSINRGMVTRSCSYEKMVEITLNSVEDYGWLEYSNTENDKNERDKTITDLISNSKDVGSNPFNVVSSVFETFLTMTPRNGSDLILPQISTSTSHNGSTRCRYLLRAPGGYALRLGVEWLPRSVRLTDALAGEELSLFDAFNSGRGSVTSEGGVVAVEARMRPGEKFRMNYQVVIA